MISCIMNTRTIIPISIKNGGAKGSLKYSILRFVVTSN